MKILRTLGLSLGALFGAAGLSVQAAPPVKIPPPGKIHQDFKQTPVAVYQLLQAMPAVKTAATPSPVSFDGTVSWKVYVEEAQGQLQNRAATWMVGTVANPDGKKLDVDLLNVGAQHRTETIWLRIVSTDPNAHITLVEDMGGSVASPKPENPAGHSGWADFYEIKPAGAKKVGGMVSFDKRYRLTSDQSSCVVEIFYDKHPPGSTVLQIEDGGPPAIPPPSEN